ncbi:hypothetical protein R5R35_005110 [Gryllus longicercus]|uniref:tRNA (adenine(58)-N(1))-methyltransferase catalytic subunit TRMT61A n=1 Tax=Gryllus longicercus TaxID=2509291 RepID=A0AAN9YWY8_9ORTH
MSFANYKSVIEQGDTVILYLSVNNMHAIKVEQRIKNKKNEMVENVFQTPYGALKVKSLIGQTFGSKVALSKGWAYVLHPTPELWTLTLPHRTQIIYTPDISIILFQLELKPGSVVLESGTGSGSLSHALIRCIKPHGHLYTFDFHAQRVEVARAEFEDHLVSEYVTVQQRDVCQTGFGPDVKGVADAVFLDLPHPWEAVPHAVEAMKEKGGRFVSFSPCIEQVQRTCEALAQQGFIELQTMECLQKELTVQTRAMSVLPLPDFSQPQHQQQPRGGGGGGVAGGERAAEGGEGGAREQCRFLTGVPPPSLPGHTGYLTAASLPPRWARTLRSPPQPLSA